MDVGSFTTPIINAFHEVIEKQSLTKLVDEWSNFQWSSFPNTNKGIEPTDENYAVYVANIADACEKKMTTNTIKRFCTTVLAIWAKDRCVPDSNQLIKLEQQSFVSITNLSIACDMIIDETELRKQFILARKYLMDYATLYDKLLREKREAEEALIHAQQNRNNMKIISDDEDDDDEVPEEPVTLPETPSTPVRSIPKVQPRAMRKRRATEKSIEIDPEVHTMKSPWGSEPRAPVARSHRPNDSESTKTAAKVESRRKSKRFEPELMASVRNSSGKPDPREYAREARIRHREITLAIAQRERAAKTALAAARAKEEEAKRAYTSRSVLAREKRPLLLPSILAERRKEGTVSTEEELKLTCEEYKDRGIADEPTKKRLLKLFSKWRRESAPMVRTDRIADFNTACNVIDTILADEILVPNKMEKVDKHFRQARKFIM